MKYFIKQANAPSIPNGTNSIVTPKDMSNRVAQKSPPPIDTPTPNPGKASTDTNQMNDSSVMPAKVASVMWNGFFDEIRKENSRYEGEGLIKEGAGPLIPGILAGARAVIPWIARMGARLIPGLARAGGQAVKGGSKLLPVTTGTGTGTAAAGGSKFMNFMNSWKGGVATSLPFMFMGGGGKAAKTAPGVGQAVSQSPFRSVVRDTTPFAGQASNANPYAKIATAMPQKLFNDKERKSPLTTRQNDVKVMQTETISGDTKPTTPPKLPKKIDSLIKTPK
jgi:hypothetical protein